MLLLLVTVEAVIAPFRPVGKTTDLLELSGSNCRYLSTFVYVTQ